MKKLAFLLVGMSSFSLAQNTLNLGSATVSAQWEVATDKAPVVLFIHDAPPMDKDYSLPRSQIFKQLASALQQNGISSLRYDQRNFKTRIFLKQSAHLADAKAALLEVFKNPSINNQKVFLYGVGEGAAIALSLAKSYPEVAGVVIQSPQVALNPTASLYNRVQLPLLQQYAQNGALGVGDLQRLDASSASENAKSILQLLLVKNSLGNWAVSSTLDTNKDGKIQLDSELNPTMQNLLSGYKSSYLDIDGAVKQALGVKVPVLLVQGDRAGTYLVGDAAPLETTLGGSSELTVKHYPTLGHTLGLADSPAEDANLPMDDAAIKDIVAWLKGH